MEFNELLPDIQSWIDSDDFINSIVSIRKEFNLKNSAIISDAVLDLILKKIKPEKLKEELLKSVPADNIDELTKKITDLLLAPIKEPLKASGIDISTISQIEKSPATLGPVSPVAPSSTQEATIPEKKLPTEQIPETKLPESSPIKPVYQENAKIEPLGENNNFPAKEINEKIQEKNAPQIATPNFDKKDSPEEQPTPFVIHEEKFPQKASMSNNSGNPLRPIFYSEEPKREEKAPFANLEFGKTGNNKKVDPDNVVDLKDLPL
jgi:hypothetical protein